MPQPLADHSFRGITTFSSLISFLLSSFELNGSFFGSSLGYSRGCSVAEEEELVGLDKIYRLARLLLEFYACLLKFSTFLY